MFTRNSTYGSHYFNGKAFPVEKEQVRNSRVRIDTAVGADSRENHIKFYP